MIRRDILTVVYLDDILIICRRGDQPDEKFKVVMDTIRDVGLPIAWDKVVSPTRVI